MGGVGGGGGGGGGGERGGQLSLLPSPYVTILICCQQHIVLAC